MDDDSGFEAPAGAAPRALSGLTRFFVVPHTHWDREWYLPFEDFKLMLADVVDELLDVLEHDAGFSSFTLDGQAVVLEDYVDARPENEARLRALLGSGRIEVGPSYVLPDELLVGGEALVRNLLMGRIVCERFGVSPSTAGYLPDSFGHPLQLPQILVGFGIESFIFSRGLGDQLDELGVIFRWRGPDGSEVCAIQQLPDYANFDGVTDAEDGLARVDSIAGRFGAALQRAGTRELLLCAGNDHVRVRRELPELCSALQRSSPETEFRIASYAQYVSALETTELPTWTGELLGSRLQNVLRGVNSARLYLKQANERAERRLLAAETLGALSALYTGEPFPVSDFRIAWRQLLRCQPHDSICGCSCDEVHRDMLVRYELLERTVGALERQALAAWAADDRAAQVSVVNVLPERRRGVVEVAGMAPLMVELDGFSARTVELAPEPRSGAPQPQGEETAIESDLIRVEVAENGTLTVVDKQTGGRFERLHRLEDEHDMGDLYNFCPVDGTAPWRSGSAACRVLRDGPLVWELELRITAERPAGLDADLRPRADTGRLTATTVVRLVKGIGRVEFKTALENRVKDHRLRVIFPVGETGAANRVRAEGQFALVERPLRPTDPRTAWVEPPDPTQHTLGVVALGALALLTRGLPEYEARQRDAGPELCLTLLRGVGLISRPSGAIATRPRGAGPQTETPEGQCLGHHELEYALVPGADSLDATELLRASQDYRHRFLVTPSGVQFDPPLTINGELVFSCIKGAEDGDGLILRCFNPGEAAANGVIAGDVELSRTRLDETETAEERIAGGAVPLGPGEIGTFRLRARPVAFS